MSDSVSVTTHTSWFSRIGKSITGVLFGLVLILAMIAALWWNEGRAVQTARSLTEGAGAVVSVAADKVDPTYENRLIHVVGPVTSDSVPSDPDFAIAQAGVRLVRTAEMYQWIEEKKTETRTKVGGGEETVTTYSYSKGWKDDWQDSSKFYQPDGHGNPPKEIGGKEMQIPEGKLVAFTLDTPVLDLIGGERSLPISPDQQAAIDSAYPGTKRVSVADNRIYLGFNPTQPAIGDYRISYEYAPLGTISVIGRQAGSGFAAYQTQAGDALLMVDEGNVAADKMFADAQAANSILTWVLRAVFIVLLVIAFSLVFAPLGVVGDVIPFVGSIVRFGTGLVALLLAILVGTVTIGLAWFWYRPVLAIIIFAGGAALAAGVIFLGRSRRKAAAAVTPAPAAPAQAA
ncbi:MAG: TMEM43 family protein [Rhizobiaceae bacterium]